MIRSSRARLGLAAVALSAALAAVVVFAPRSPEALQATVGGLGAAAPLVLLGAWVVLTPALVSGTMLAAGGGMLLGAVPGVLVALAGATLGAGAAFAVARVVGPSLPAATRADRGRVRRLQARVERRPVLAVALLRAAPGMPATLLNYALGLSRVRARHFLVGITLGGAPRAAGYALLGAGLADPATRMLPLAAGGGALLIAAVAAGTWRVRRVRAD